MTNYVICERSLHHAHAGSKARDDIRQVLESQSWQPFEVRPGENKGYFDKLVCVGRTLGTNRSLRGRGVGAISAHHVQQGVAVRLAFRA